MISIRRERSPHGIPPKKNLFINSVMKPAQNTAEANAIINPSNPARTDI
jgi:hypothetical protein